MTSVTIYRTAWCPYCQRAEALLFEKQKNHSSQHLQIDIIDIEKHPNKRAEMIQRSGRTSVPQIFINDQAIGGYDDMAALQRSNQLDGLLQLSSSP